MKQLEGKKKGLQDHLLGLKFNMEDRKLACVEAEKRVQNVEASFQSLVNQQATPTL
jgi:hypothetical protein